MHLCHAAYQSTQNRRYCDPADPAALIHYATTTALERRIELTANEKTDLYAFLLTLTDREFLFNPDVGFPKK